MAHRVQVNSGVTGLALPDGNIYDGGDDGVEVLLTDAEFEALRDSLFPGTLTDLGVEEDPGLTDYVTEAELAAALVGVGGGGGAPTSLPVYVNGQPSYRVDDVYLDLAAGLPYPMYRTTAAGTDPPPAANWELLPYTYDGGVWDAETAYLANQTASYDSYSQADGFIQGVYGAINDSTGEVPNLSDDWELVFALYADPGEVRAIRWVSSQDRVWSNTEIVDSHVSTVARESKLVVDFVSLGNSEQFTLQLLDKSRQFNYSGLFASVQKMTDATGLVSDGQGVVAWNAGQFIEEVIPATVPVPDSGIIPIFRHVVVAEADLSDDEAGTALSIALEDDVAVITTHEPGIYRLLSFLYWMA